MGQLLNKKPLLIAFAVFIVFSVVFTESLAAEDHDLDHDCTGESCPFCLQIIAAKNFLKSLKYAGLASFAAFCPMSPVHHPAKITDFAPLPYSPVTLKVRFNT